MKCILTKWLFSVNNLKSLEVTPSLKNENKFKPERGISETHRTPDTPLELIPHFLVKDYLSNLANVSQACEGRYPELDDIE
jgi:hypothetical protein